MNQSSNYGWMADTARSNAYLNQGSQLNNSAIQTGQTTAQLQSSLMQGLNSTYNAQANNATQLYNSAQNRSLTQNLAQQAQNNWNKANDTNQNLAYATLGTNLARTGWDAYRYYNQPSSNLSNLSNISSYSPAVSYYPDASMAWTYLD
jgi:hypothetical protein